MNILEKLTGKKKSLVLVLVGILGVALILFGSFGEKKEEKTEETKKSDDIMAYIETIENKIGNITEQITGSRHVRVIVSVSSGSEFQYIVNEENRDDKTSKEYVTVRTEDGEMPILLKEIYPEIIGVSVACEGGDSAVIQEKLIRVISTTYGLASNRICIVGIS